MKTILAGDAPLKLSLYADSAVGRDVQPLFIPEIEGDWCVTLMPAYRVGRLGKSVPAKYADRYIDAVSVVALMHPASVRPEAGAVPGWLSLMDSAVTTGRWLTQWQASDTEGDAASALSLASGIATLKTGDVIIPPVKGRTVSLKPCDVITAEIGAEQVLRLKIR